MSKLRRIVLVRHGETDGNSSVRFHGSTDVGLSDEGRAQMREARKRMTREFFDLVVASTLRRAWQGVAPDPREPLARSGPRECRW